MTPKLGFLHRTTLGLALASGLATGCVIEAGPVRKIADEAFDQTWSTKNGRVRPPELRTHTVAPIEESLERLERLEVLEVTDLVSSRTVHDWVPYGGFWSSTEVEMSDEEIATRLEHFVEVAEAAAASVTSIPEDRQGLCFPAFEDSYCLTNETHDADLAAIADLEIVNAASIVRDRVDHQALCYSSWDTVTENECLRALKLDAIVEATADFPNRRTPIEDPG